MKTGVTLVVALLTLLAAAGPAAACEMAGPNTHVGAVLTIDGSRAGFTLRDMQTRRPITFLASPELLAGVRVNDEIVVVYTPEGESLRAKSIRRMGG